MADQNSYDPYNPYNQQNPQQQPPYPAPVATQAPPPGGQPPQYPPPNPSYAPAPVPPKKKKTALIVVSIVVGVLLICCLIFAVLAWIGYTAEKNESKQPASTSTTQVEPTPSPTPEPAPAPDPEPEPSAAEFADTKKVGNEKVGYVEVPSTWVNFKDLEGSGTTQFSNGIGTQIVSMDALNTDDVTAYDYAQALAMVLEDDGMQELTLATVHDIPGYEAYQVYGVYYEQGTVLVCWVFEDGTGITHYLAVEGPVDSPFELFEIPQSFTLK